MENHKTSLILLFIISNIPAFGQDQKIDSLKGIASASPDSPQKVQILLQISQAYQNTSLTDAVNYVTLAKDLSVKIKYNEGLGNSYRFLGNYYKRLGKYPEALNAYAEGLDVFTKMHDLIGQSVIYNNFGSLYSDQGQESKALDYYFKSLKLGEQANDKKRIVTALSNIGNIYLNNGGTNKKALEKALEYFLRELPLGRELKDDQIVGTVTVNIGEVYMNDNKNDSAIFYFRQSLDAFANTGDVCYTLNDIGKLYKKTRNYDSAIIYHQRALRIATNLGSQEDMASSLLGIAQIYLQQKKTRNALLAYQKAKDIATALDLQYQLREAYQGLTSCYTSLNDYNNAFKYQTLLFGIKDSISSNETDEKLARLEFNFQIEKKQTEIDLLTKDKLLKESDLRRQTIERNAVTLGLVLIFIIAFIVFRGYRNKVKTNSEILTVELMKSKMSYNEMQASFQQELLRTQLEIQEQTMKKISQEIHDNIGIELTLVKHALHAISSKEKKEEEKINDAVNLLTRAIQDLRNLSRSLNTDKIQAIGINNAIELELEQLKKISTLNIHLDLQGAPVIIDSKIEIILFRIVQEALNNIIKHAKASNIRVSIVYAHNELQLIIEDDGMGFNTSDKNLWGNGLYNIESRCKVINAKIQLKSTIGKGTTIHILWHQPNELVKNIQDDKTPFS